MLGGVELKEDEAGCASARGSGCSTERTLAELVDTAGRCEDDGGHGYGGGTAAAASAMAEGSEGERQGEWACPGGSVHDMEAFRGITLARATAGRQRGGVASS